MAEDQNPASDFAREDDLRLHIQDLQRQLGDVKAQNKAIWDLLVRLGSRLQLSSTSIKTAVSSLLDFDIFWDESTEHEFLEVIDSSIDEAANLIVLMTLAFRSQAKSLEIKVEPNMIQEILITLQSGISKSGRGPKLNIKHPSDGKPALVDYQYLSVALRLLIEVIIGETKKAEQVSVQVKETAEHWHLEIDDIETSIVTLIRHFFEHQNDISTYVSRILPENVLKLMTACRILYLQDIELCLQHSVDKPTSLCLVIPAVTNDQRMRRRFLV